jgi:hypothetical protein
VHLDGARPNAGKRLHETEMIGLPALVRLVSNWFLTS